MKAYHQKVKSRMGKLEKVEVSQISRDHNTHADALACLASALASEVTQRIIIENRERLSIDETKAEQVLPTQVQGAPSG